MSDLIERKDALDCLDSGDFDSYEDYSRTFDTIEDIPSVNRWIPCSERMPEDGQRVLICSKSKRFFDVIFRANAQTPSFDAKIFGKVYTWYCEDIIKWMPLPEAPEGGEHNGTE